MSLNRNIPARWIVLVILLLILTFTSVYCLGIFTNASPPITPESSSRFPLRALWSIDTGEEVRSLAEDEGVVYAYTEEDRLLAIDALKGCTIWQTDIGNDDAHSYSPITLFLEEDSLFVANHTALYRLATTTGEIIWKNTYLGSGSKEILAASDNHLFLQNISWRVYAIRKLTGTVDWYISQGRGGVYLSTEESGKIYMYYGHTLYAYDDSSGDLIWQAEIGSSRYEFLDKGVFYFTPIEGRIVKNLAAFSLENAAEIWRVQSSHYIDQLLVSEDAIYTLGSDDITKTDPRDGHTIWEKGLESNIYRKPVILGDVIYFRGALDDKMIALENSSGEYLGELKIQARRNFTASLDDDYYVGDESPAGTLLIFSEKASVYAYGNK